MNRTALAKALEDRIVARQAFGQSCRPGTVIRVGEQAWRIEDGWLPGLEGARFLEWRGEVNYDDPLTVTREGGWFFPFIIGNKRRTLWPLRSDGRLAPRPASAEGWAI
jgi:hypothetical protein